MELARSVLDYTVQFWTLDHRFWLSPGVSWEQVRSPGKENVLKPQPYHFLYAFLLTGVWLLARKIYEQFVALPLGRYFRVNERQRRMPATNDVLEKAFKKGRHPSSKVVSGLAKDVDWSERKIERWFRRRRGVNVPNDMTKFKEGTWRLVCYVFLLVVGGSIILKKPFWTDTTLCWTGYPERAMDFDLFIYYLIELSFYMSLSVSHFSDIKRKDFWEMLTHHMATILLISFSFITNYLPLGAMIMFIHDIADPWLEIAKAVGYTRQPGDGRTAKQCFGEGLFAVFMVTFFYTRLYVFPTRCIYSAWYEMRGILGPEEWPMHKLFTALLLVLWCLHMFWSYHIIRVLITSITAGKVVGDSRSDDEASEDETARADGAGSVTAKHRMTNGLRPVISNGHCSGPVVSNGCVAVTTDDNAMQ